VAKTGYKFYLKNPRKTINFVIGEEEFKITPIIQSVVIEEGNSAKYTFKLFTELFFRKYSFTLGFGATFDYLKDRNIMIILKNTLKWGNQKLDN